MSTTEDLLADLLAEETPEMRAHHARQMAEYNVMPCRYDSVRECYVHGYLPRRPCGHTCYGAFYKKPCPQCNRPLTGRRRTRKRWRRQGRR
jgi:hypothetical protein